MRAQSEEWVKCPVCDADIWERRPPFRFGPNRFDCESCGSTLRFSDRSQKRLVWVLVALFAFGPVAILASKVLGGLAGAITAICGAVAVLGVLVWQGRVSQLEVIE